MGEIRIGVIGDFDPENPTHRATNDALGHASASLGEEVSVAWLPTETLAEDTAAKLEDFDGLWCAPGSPYQSLEGALKAVRFAREQDRPFIGTCGGFQHAMLEYARNVLGFEDAQHAEYDPYASELFITPLTCSLAGQRMSVHIRSGTLASRLYDTTKPTEDYYCNFGLNPAYHRDIQRGGLQITGSESDGEARIVELPTHRFFLSTLFVPQTSSTMEEPHPLVSGFVRAAGEFAGERRANLSTGARR